MLQGLSSTMMGKTRTCPHCKATILESAAICPQCKHHLKFGAAAVAAQARPGVCAFKVEGTLQHAVGGADWASSVVLRSRNDRAKELSRQVVGVGALRPTESRTFTLSV